MNNHKEVVILYDEKDDPVFETDWENVLYIQKITAKPSSVSIGPVAIGTIAIGYGAESIRRVTAYRIKWKEHSDYTECRAVRYVRTYKGTIVLDDAPEAKVKDVGEDKVTIENLDDLVIIDEDESSEGETSVAPFAPPREVLVIA